MDRRQLAADLADLVAEAGDTASALVWARLRPLIVNAWGSATRTLVAAGAMDEGALRAISSAWKPPEQLGGLLVDLYDQGNLHGTMGFFGDLGSAPADVVDALGGPVFDQAARAYMAEASNRLAGIGDVAWGEARRVIHEQMGTGLGREDTKQALERTLSVSEFRADTIARTELGAAANAGVAHAGDALVAAGFRVEKEWFAQHDPRTRPTHVAADGQRAPLNGFFTVGGVEMSRPLDPMGPAEEVVNCRCTMLMVEAPGQPEATATIEAQPSTLNTPPLTDEQYAQLKPRWDLNKRKRVIAALRSTPAGKVLEETLSGFQSGASRGIPLLKTNLAKHLAGQALEPGAVARVENLLAALRNSPLQPPQRLYRGLRLDLDPDEVVARFAGRSSFDLNLSSFTADRKMAQSYAESGGAGASGSKNRKRFTNVIFDLDTSGRTKALPLENLAKNSLFANEKEWITGGRFDLLDVVKSRDGRTVVMKLRQVAVLGD